MNPICKKYVKSFSLVEVVIALSLSVFALIAVMALLPNASKTQMQAMDLSVVSQISRKIFTEARQADFDQLIQGNALTYRYFDYEGLEVPRARQVYTAEVRMDPKTDVPGPGTGRTNLFNMARLRVRVTRNPLGSNPTDSALFTPTNPNIRTAANYIARHESQVK